MTFCTSSIISKVALFFQDCKEFFYLKILNKRIPLAVGEKIYYSIGGFCKVLKIEVFKEFKKAFLVTVRDDKTKKVVQFSTIYHKKKGKK